MARTLLVPNMMHKHRQPQADQRSHGFALVLALSLMAFVVLLLLSITTLVRVETTASAHKLDRLHAEENARLALMIALGELQQHAGPDQRVSARADILNAAITNPFWTGIWDTTQPNATPKWLVSGETADPTQTASRNTTFEAAAVSNRFGATQVPTDTTSTGEFAWWVSDEGIKAALAPDTRLPDALESLAVDEAHLDYDANTTRLLAAQHDPSFDYPDLFDINRLDTATRHSLERITSIAQIPALLSNQAVATQTSISTSLQHDHTYGNRFVLSDTANSGLKKDLSFLKTLDPESTSQAELDALYADPNNLITPEVIQLVQFRGNPTAYPDDEILGMQIGEDDIATTEAKANHFDLVPVISELQVSLGVASDDGNVSNSTTTESQVYLAYKVYLELWNPYTIPILIGDPTMDDSRGFSDIEVEINNLPTVSILNNNTGDSFVGTLPDINIRWSTHHDRKILRPGMVFRTSLPLDPSGSSVLANYHGTNDTGTIQVPIGIGTTIRGSRSDNYTGNFSMNGAAVEIVMNGLNQSGTRREVARVELDNYNDFTINYNYNSFNNRATWLKRVPTSSKGAFGINTVSLEVPGYAFGFRYRMLDEQEAPGSIDDLSRWLSEYDIRNRLVEADMGSWDINDAWASADPNPYDFRVNGLDTELGAFDHGEGFKGDHFFHYETASSYTGRRDRIARAIDLPTCEVSQIGTLRALKYRDYPANAVANPWGDELNEHYDRYFFSTLPDPDIEPWDGLEPLANGRLLKSDSTPQLTDTDAARSLIVSNGFNINSTSAAAWKSVLSGKSYLAGDFESRYEQAESGAPAWFPKTEAINKLFVNHPHSMIYNLSESASDSRYDFVSRTNEDDYLDAFSINNISWLNTLQYPSFHQSIREATNTDISELSDAIVESLQAYSATTGHPPFSMADYLNSGLLQDAVDSVPSINNRNSDTDYIPAHSASHISQATIMNAISAYSFVRSDTFRIRTYGNATNDITGASSAGVYLEAIVQRTPEPHEDSALGRQFRIVSLKRIPSIQ